MLIYFVWGTRGRSETCSWLLVRNVAVGMCVYLGASNWVSIGLLLRRENYFWSVFLCRIPESYIGFSRRGGLIQGIINYKPWRVDRVFYGKTVNDYSPNRSCSLRNYDKFGALGTSVDYIDLDAVEGGQEKTEVEQILSKVGHHWRTCIKDVHIGLQTSKFKRTQRIDAESAPLAVRV